MGRDRVGGRTSGRMPGRRSCDGVNTTGFGRRATQGEAGVEGGVYSFSLALDAHTLLCGTACWVIRPGGVVY